jgi:hypothetical protein
MSVQEITLSHGSSACLALCVGYSQVSILVPMNILPLGHSLPLIAITDIGTQDTKVYRYIDTFLQVLWMFHISIKAFADW